MCEYCNRIITIDGNAQNYLLLCISLCKHNQSCGQFLNGVQVTTRARQLAASGSICSSCMCCRCVIYLARENYTLHDIFITRQTRVEKSTLRRCHDPFSQHPLLFFAHGTCRGGQHRLTVPIGVAAALSSPRALRLE